MLKLYKSWLFVVLVTLSFNGYAQHTHKGKEVDHVTFWDTLFGNEEEFMVCYPKDHQGFFYAIILLSIVSLFMAIFIFYSFRKYNRKLKKSSAIIHQKNSEMLESIRYAQRIQNTILPTESEFKLIIPTGFVFFRPKDIVSGDFYWVHQVESKKIFAVIDCTGHGVPGAFLSLIGFNGIIRAVKDDQILSPDMIFDRMNDYVKIALRQFQNEELSDGMEGGIAVYDEQTKTLEFVGARMNLIHISKGELNLIRGSKLTIGTSDMNLVGPPENNQIQLQSTDSFYLYSDGVVDQFGSNGRGKFKISRLKELLLQVHPHLSEIQLATIQDTFKQWQGETEQIDDMTLLGVKVD